MLKQLLEKRDAASKAIVQLRDILKTEGRDLTAEEQTNLDTAFADYDATNKKIEDIQRADNIDKQMRSMDNQRDFEAENAKKNQITQQDRNLAFHGWATGGKTEEVRAAMAKCKLIPSNEMEVKLHRSMPKTQKELAEMRAVMSVGTDAAGGYTVPEGFVYNLEKAMLWFGPMLEVADVMRTATGNDLPWPTANDTGNTGALVAEAGDVTGGGIPTFAQTVFNAYKFTSKHIVVSSELLQDSAFNMAEYLGEAIGERLGRAINTYCTTGTGSSQPNGIVTAATDLDTATASTLVADDFISLEYAVDRAYRRGAKYMMNDAIQQILRKLKDSDGQYLWQPALTAGQPATFGGYTIETNNDMASTTTDDDVVAVFGALNKYKIRMVQGLRLRRLVELYAGTDQEGFVGFLRADGDLLNAGTNPVKKLSIKAATT